MKTWKQLKKQSLKKTIQRLTECQIQIKRDFKSLKSEKKDITDKSYYIRTLNSLHNDIMYNKAELSAYYSELNEINKKQDSHIITKDKYICNGSLTSTFKYETYILCYDIDALQIYKTTHITETGYKATDIIGLSCDFRYHNIIKEGSKEELEKELAIINEKIGCIPEQEELNKLRDESKKRSEKQTKKRNDFNKKIEKLKKEFDESMKEETLSIYNLKEDMHKLNMKIKKQKELIYKGLHNDN